LPVPSWPRRPQASSSRWLCIGCCRTGRHDCRQLRAFTRGWSETP
jgi:hypothetical protein